MISGAFVTGTDTGAGKSVACAWLARGWQAAYWKPIQSGFPPDDDTAEVARLSGQPCFPPAFHFKAPLSPHEAARLEGRTLGVNDFVLPASPLPLIVEGAGGLLVPLNERETMADLIAHLGLPVIIAARSTLGTINHTLLTLEALRARHLPILGVVLSGPSSPANRDAIALHGKCRILGEIPPLDPLTPQALAQIPPPLSLESLS